MRIKGFSVDRGDVYAVAGTAVGVGLVLVSSPVASAVYERVASSFLGLLALVVLILGGMLLAVASISYVMRASRTYRAPGRLHPNTDCVFCDAMERAQREVSA